ncbi:MAG TPA: hypothetical protein VIW67_18305, partial [Terriglobales bacterium]
CKLKFADGPKEACPKCKTPIKDMTHPLRRTYTYYHCTRSSNPFCTEHSIERKELERQVTRFVERVELPDLHRHWLNACFGRLQKDRNAEVLPVIIDSFAGHAPTIQREIVMAIFSTLVLKDRKLIVSLKPPFSFPGKSELSADPDKKPFGEEALQKQVA